ncbi:MAG TPA: hypothetical protein VKU41_31795 [Polyangiaceae bacterium]|nr:hypothetical protein [Polyangiaceae bacterium]
MGRLGTRALGLGLGAVVGVSVCGGWGCSGNKATELVPGVMTQVVVPRDLHSIQINVTANGKPVFCAQYDVSNGTATLPATLGVVSGGSASTVVVVEIRGYDTAGSMGDALAGCSATNVGSGGTGGPRMLRRSIQSFVENHILYLPMPLSYSCFDVDCSAQGDSSTCKGAQCVDAHVDSKTLVDFTPALVDGTDVCFSPSECLPPSATVSAIPVDLSRCIYGFPYTPPSSRASPGLNVRVYFEDVTVTKDPQTNNLTPSTTGGEAEILDLDPDEGFTLASAADAGIGPSEAAAGDAGQVTPPPKQLFQLAPGLCKLAQVAANPPVPTTATTSYRMISRVEVANTCAPKVQLLPICKTELVPVGAAVLPGGKTTMAATANGTCEISAPLIPAPSAVYIGMDQSVRMHGAFGDKGSATTLSLSFDDPVFKRTYAAFQFLPGLDSDCAGATSSFTSPLVAFGLAGASQPAIASQLKGWKPSEAGGGSGTCMFTSDCNGGGVCSATAESTGTCYAAAGISHLDLEAAMRLDVGAYAGVTNFLQGKESPDIAAAMFFLNRTPDNSSVANGGNDCPGTGTTSTAQAAIEAQVLAAFNGTPSLQTYFVVLDNDAHDTHMAGGAFTFFQQVQTDFANMGLPDAVSTLDGSQDAKTVLTNFSNIVTKLGTCLYELPKGLTSTSQAQVQFAPPGVPAGSGETVVSADPNCNAANQTSANGWNIDSATGRLRICGKPCTDLRNLILAETGQAVANSLTVPDIPVTVSFNCGGSGGGSSSGGASDSGGSSGGGSSGSGGGQDGASMMMTSVDSGTSVSDGSLGADGTAGGGGDAGPAAADASGQSFEAGLIVTDAARIGD